MLNGNVQTCLIVVPSNTSSMKGIVNSMAEGILTLTDATFDEQIGAAGTPVLVDFWAEWCGPCKMISPILEEIAKDQAGRITIAKINVDENPDISRRFDVMSIPTLLLFKDGELTHRTVGAKGKNQLMTELDQHL